MLAHIYQLRTIKIRGLSSTIRGFKTNQKVAIIGCGPSGLATLNAFKKVEEMGCGVPDIVVFDKQKRAGGVWNYTWRTDVDSGGEHIHPSMYKHLYTNTPKECLEYPDYTFMDHYKTPITSFPPRQILMDYFVARSATVMGETDIRYESPVRYVSFDEVTKQFTVTFHDYRNNLSTSEIFDYIVCCSGHFSYPFAPSYEGFQNFEGSIIHSHSIRSALIYRGLNVVIVGTSFSAEDVASLCWKFGAKRIVLSYRNTPMPYHWPPKVENRPAISYVEKNECHFVDGSSFTADAIILCTGYLYHFPFMAQDIKLVTESSMGWNKNLYQGVCLEGNHKVFYLGMQKQIFTFALFEAQAAWVVDAIVGRIDIPEKRIMRELATKWTKREEDMTTFQHRIAFQGDYVQSLLYQTPHTAPKVNVPALKQLFHNWYEHKVSGILSFREYTHRSAYNGISSVPMQRTWLSSMDDDDDKYLEACKPTTQYNPDIDFTFRYT